MKGRPTLVRLCIIIAMKEALFLLLAPFFPEQMKLRNVSDHLYAPLFTSYSVFFFLTCLSTGRFIMPKLGRSMTLRVGLLLHAFACGCFVLIYFIQRQSFFILLSFVGRITEGVGAGFLQTAAYSELMIQYKEQQSMVVGYLTFSGVFGNLIGMVFSSFLSFLLGGIGPFAFFGFIFLLFAITQNKIIHFVQFEDHSSEMFSIQVLNIYQQPFLLHQYTVKRYSSSSMQSEVGENQNNYHGHDYEQKYMTPKIKKEKKIENASYREVLKNGRAIFAFLSIAFGLSLWTFIDTTLTNKLQQDFSLSSQVVCLFYTLQCAGFLVTSPHTHKVIKRFNPIKLVIIAFVIQAIAVFLMGPSQKLNLPNRMWLTGVGLVLAGLSSPFISIPSYPELEYSLINNVEGKRYDPHQLSDIISGLFNSAYSMGTIIGPITASYISIATSFRTCCDIIAASVIVFAGLYLCIILIPQQIRLKKSQQQHKDMQQQLVEINH